MGRPVGQRRCLRALGLVGLALTCLGGCASARVAAFHAPMHPANTEAVTFRAEANGTVDKIVLSYRRFNLTVALGVLIQTEVVPMTDLATCDPAGTISTLTCSHTMPSAFPASSLIEFQATVYDGDGKTNSDVYSFAAGDYPLPDDPIPIRLKGDTAGHLDVVFIPDTDITVANFRSQLGTVVEQIYFKYEAIKTWRGLYNFYYSAQQGNYEESCSFTNPSNMATLTAVGDAVLFLHQNTLRDCRSGKRISSEINYDKSMIHESGHVLFNLQDEYCCDSSYSPQACYQNLFSSLASCQTEAANIGYPTSNCVQLTDGTTTLSFWRIDPSGANGCMMGPHQHSSDSDFNQACRRRINHRYGQCGAGDCFSSPECP